jgi:HTH-type transcriptional regulator, sugar sensing transcriptional regulator
MDNNTEILLGIGFNRLEAEVYIHMLTHKPSTAYKIGKEINKPTANVYKAIESLAKKGAVIIEDNKNKLCKAVNSNEFLSHYENSIIEKAKSAKKLLSNLNDEIADEKSYSIESVPLVFERFRSMMSRCKTIAVVDAFPKALNLVVVAIEEATKRGVEVYVEAYQPIKIKGADVTCAIIGEKALTHWKSQQLNLIIDGEEHLIALMDDNLETVKQATWSSNNYMSCILHAGCLREQTIMKIMAETDNPDFKMKVKQLLDNQKFFFNTNISGFNKLFK